MTYPLPGSEATYIITSSGHEAVTMPSGIEVRAIPLLASRGGDSMPGSTGHMRAATWLLQQAIECIDSIFDDWYAAFGRQRGFKLSTIQQGVPCRMCETQRLALSAPCCIADIPSKKNAEGNFYLFSSPICAHAVAVTQVLQCPIHGSINVREMAPDIVGIFFYCHVLSYLSSP